MTIRFERPFVILAILGNLLSCKEPGGEEEKTLRPVSFAEKFNSRGEDPSLLLGCIVYAEEAKEHLNMDSVAGFYAVSNAYSAYSQGLHAVRIDSVIDVFISDHKPVDFSTNQAQRCIISFKEGYRIVDLIFAGIEDNRDDLAKELEEKMEKTPEVMKIYRRYVTSDRVLSSLASSEGSTLNIHLAYYFSKLSGKQRNAVLKLLL